MFDSRLRLFIDPTLQKIAAHLVRTGLKPNHVTLAGFMIGLVGCMCLLFEAYGAAFTALILNRACDGLDGPLARARADGATDFGGYLDIVLDFFIYATYPIAFAIGAASQTVWIVTGVLMIGIFASGITFLAYAIIAAKRGQTTQHQGRKSFYYVSGLAEGAETIIFLSLICLLPQFYVWLAGGFAALCLVTGIGRVLQAAQDFQ